MALSEREVYAKTIYAEARGESEEGQRGVAWVTKNRAEKNRSYWGGGTIKDVCLHPGQFECWKNKHDIDTSEKAAYERALKVVDRVSKESSDKDPTGGADHYNNPDKEGYPPWTKNCKKGVKIGNHQFYHGP